MCEFTHACVCLYFWVSECLYMYIQCAMEYNKHTSVIDTCNESYVNIVYEY